MAIGSVDIETFLALSRNFPVLDVRSPSEYRHAHIPGARNLPLFSDEERKVVGTAYKQESREKAIKIGLDYFGVKMRAMVEQVESLLASQPGSLPEKQVLVHCWRGGMRSAGVAWLLDLYGFKVNTLQGGYKAYRQYVRQSFEVPFDMTIIGGYTGSGKTGILQKLARLGEAVIDLEELAAHKGSAFGHLGLPDQPSQEMFENLLGTVIRSQLQLLESKQAIAGEVPTVYLEDESLRIGTLMIPPGFYKRMRQSACFFLDIPFEQRLRYILKDYGVADRDKLIQATIRIQKRLGGLETKQAVNFLLENKIEAAFRILLSYYDKWYLKGLPNREEGCPPIFYLPASEVDEVRNAQLLLQARMARQQEA